MDTDVDSLEGQDEQDIFWGVHTSSEPPRKRARKCCVAAFVRPGQRVHPLSAYFGSPAYNRAISAKSETEVLSTFLADEIIDDDDDDKDVFISYVLDDFVVYRTPDVKPLAEQNSEGSIVAAHLRQQGQRGQGEYDLPSTVYVAKGLKNLVFDGVLKSDGKEEVLHGIPFETLSISNIATPSKHNVTKAIWIQSHQGAKAHVKGGVWYELGSPAEEYIEHWKAFEWLALFVKYVSDALEICVNRGEEVTLSYFRSKFAAEMRMLHGGDHIFEHWMAAFGKDDFRIPMATHAEFLWHQIQTAIPGGETSMKFFTQSIWGEILPSDLTAIPPAHDPRHARPRCVVTQYVNKLFEWIFKDRLEVVEPEMNLRGFDIPVHTHKIESRDLRNSNRATSKSPVHSSFHHDEYQSAIYPRFSTRTTGSIKVGDVIELPREEETRWKGSTQRWYAMVTNRWKNAKDVWKLSILWLYWPEDVALCKSMKYPYPNELFFSDHCECGKPVAVEDVIRKVAVEFFCIDGKPKDPNAEFFIRQKYVSVEDNTRVVTLKAEDIAPEALYPCPCRQVEALPVFQRGDFVLVSQRDRDRLQPYQFEAYEDKRARLRRLDRRREVHGTGKVNELIWTVEMEEVSVNKVVRKCHVVRVEEGEEVPRLADWGGSSDWFFYRQISNKIEGGSDIEDKQNEELVDLLVSVAVSIPTTIPEDLPESVSPSESKFDLFAAKSLDCSDPLLGSRFTSSSTRGSYVSLEGKLRGLDLFCGGGNFGRGIEDGGAVHHTWAVDIDINALHTYRANLETDKTNLYLGSINNFLFDIIRRRAEHLPQPGDIDLILAGSPCQGFSNANRAGRGAEKSLRNAVLVCATLTAIDLFRPKYAILENVTAMASPAPGPHANPPINVANQMLCALIGMGYQCRAFILDACSFGAPQSRSRIFIEIAAPGCILPEIPSSSHAHPPSTRRLSLGKTAANLRFAPRDLESLTSFPPAQLRDSWDDLPSIGNGHLNMCIPYPDHRPYWTMNARDRAITAHIPASDSAFRHPNYEYALRRGLMPHHLKLPTATGKEKSHRFERLAGDELAGTVTCFLNPVSGPCGRALHYRENRVFSILEAKRLQGFFDTDVLVGSPRTCFKIIGNSVCRQVAFALGGKLADAVMSGRVGNGRRVLEENEISREEKLRFGPMETKRTRSIGIMVMVEQKKSRQGVGENIPIQEGFTASNRASMDTTVHLTGIERRDGIEISVIRRSRKNIAKTQDR